MIDIYTVRDILNTCKSCILIMSKQSLSKQENITPPQIARMFNINVSTVKRWVNKGFIASKRTPGGHRRISPTDIQNFIRHYPTLAPKSYILNAITKHEYPKPDWRMYYDDIQKNVGLSKSTILENLYMQGVPVADILEGVVSPTLRHIGTQWKNNKLAIYEEHRMSFLVRLDLLKLQQLVPEKTTLKRIAIIGCVQNDHHEIPLLMLSILMRQNGFQPLILGINVPEAEMLEAIKKYKPKLVALSKTYSRSGTPTYLQNVMSLCKKTQTACIVGGRGWTHQELLRHQNHYASSASSAEQMTKKSAIQNAIPQKIV